MIYSDWAENYEDYGLPNVLHYTFSVLNDIYTSVCDEGSQYNDHAERSTVPVFKSQVDFQVNGIPWLSQKPLGK